MDLSCTSFVLGLHPFVAYAHPLPGLSVISCQIYLSWSKSSIAVCCFLLIVYFYNSWAFVLLLEVHCRYFPFLAYFSVQGKRALKKDAARRKPSEVKSQIEVLANAFWYCNHSHCCCYYFISSSPTYRIWSWVEGTMRWKRFQGDQALVKEVSNCFWLTSC